MPILRFVRQLARRMPAYVAKRSVPLVMHASRKSVGMLHNASRHYGTAVASTASMFVLLTAIADEEFIQSLIESYCAAQNYRFSYLIPQSVYAQLSWLIHNEINSPELRAKLSGDNINMEIKRSLSRLYCFDLLLREDIPVNDAYRQFIISQGNNPLTLVHFEQLREQASALTFDEREAIRASCILTKSQRGDQVLKMQGMRDVPSDSEEFLTWLSRNPEAMAHFPVCATLTESQKALLQRIYIPLHGRAIPFTEGALPMVQHVPDLNTVWKMRWWVNLMGFRGHEGAGAKYLNDKRFEFFQDCYQLMERHQNDPGAITRSWLQKLAEVSNLKEHALMPYEEMVVAHILSFYGEYLPPDKVGEVVLGYKRYKAEHVNDCASLVKNYSAFIESQAKTPTYTVAILATAESSGASMCDSVEYTLQVLQQLHQQQSLMESSIISCRDEAWYNNLVPKIGMWQQSGRQHLQCAVIQKNNEHVLSCQLPA